MIKIENYGNKIKVKGNIKSIAHYNELKDNIETIIISHKSVEVELIDSMSLTSSVIGYFTKIVNLDNVVLKLSINDERLFELLDDLGLVQVLNVQRMSK